MKLYTRLLAGVLLITISTYWVTNSLGQGQVIISLDPNTTYQTITGWEAVAQAGQSECSGFPTYKDELFVQAVNDLGINRLRLEIYSGTENPVDYFTQFITGQINSTEYKAHWYEIINDNVDPVVNNPAGFQFAALDYTIDKVVLPMKQLLEAKGEKLYINLNVIDFACCQGSSTLEYQNSPQEYAEFIVVTYLHLKNKYGWAPDAVEVVLEPDNTPWTGTQIGNAIAATAKRLEAHGFTPRFIAPSTTNMGNASTYFDELIQVSGVQPYLEELSYHRYSGVSDANLQAIANRAVQHSINTAMLEHIGSNYQDLHKDLKIGRNSAWQQFTLAYCSTGDNGGAYYQITYSDPNTPVINMGSRTKFLRQYFKFVRRGAVRIEVSSTNSNFDPLAFINTDGKYVVVVQASSSGTFAITGLPAGVYGIKYTTTSQYDIDAADITLAASQSLQATMPQNGVITIYAKAAATSTPPTGVVIGGPVTGVTRVPYTFTVTVSPKTTTLPVTYLWRATGQPQVASSGGISNTVTFKWDKPTTQTISVTATNTGGAVVSMHTITLSALPPSSTVPPGVVTLGGPVRGAVRAPMVFIATVSPVTTTLPITYRWEATGQSLVTNVGKLTDTVAFTWDIPTSQTITVTATNNAGTVVDRHIIELSTFAPDELVIEGPIKGVVHLPYLFTATVSPVTATLPITYRWQATGQPQMTSTGGLSDTFHFTWAESGHQTVTVTATNAAGAVSGTHMIELTPPIPPTGVTIRGPETGFIGRSNLFTATVRPLTVTQPITFAWQTTEQAPVVHVSGVRDNATFTWDTVSTQTITVAVTNAAGMASATHTIVIDRGHDLYLPVIRAEQTETRAEMNRIATVHE